MAPLATPAAALLDLAFPPRCVACGAPTVDRAVADSAFCEPCESDLPRFHAPCCRRCGAPAPTAEAPIDGCPACRDERWAFDAVVALGPYDGLLRHLILGAKSQTHGRVAEALGRRLAITEFDRLSAESAAAVVAIPMHWTRRFVRGVNSAERLAAGVERELRVRRRSPLRRIRQTPRQTEVAPSARPRNVRGAFAASPTKRLTGRTVLLVDDVLTTGSTCSAAARALKRAGAGRVVAAVAARRVGGL